MTHAGKFPVFAQPTHPEMHFLFFFFCEKVNINLVELLQMIIPEKLKVMCKSQIDLCWYFLPMVQCPVVGFPMFSTGRCNPTHTGLVLPHLS